jgi:hypothetical protein
VADARLREAFRKEKATPIAPSLLLDFEGDKQLDPRVTFTRASSARYYNGVTTAKAEQNLLLNSVWSGAASGTPGTIPTSWSAPVFDGSIDSVALGSDAISNVLTLSATSARQIIQQTVTVLANLVYQGQLYLISNANSLPINQILSWVTIPSGSTASYFINGVAALGTDIPAAGSLLVHQLSVSTTAGTPLFRIGVGCQSNSTGTISITRPQLEQRSAVTAYTPTTTQPITNYIPTLLTATDNVARFDHNPTTGESLGLLVEEQRTNLVLRSEEFDNAYWTKTNATITANTIVVPDGTLTGDKLVSTNGSTSSSLQRQVTSLTAGASYTFSYFVKSDGVVPFVQLVCLDGANVSRAWFNLTTGATGTTAGSFVNPVATSCGNGWFRVTATITLTGTNPFFIVGNATGDNINGYTGDGYSGIYIWGAQLEAGAFATSYIPTVASQVTRSADRASMTGANFSSWYNAGQGTFYQEASTVNVFGPSLGFSVDNGTSNNRISVSVNGSATLAQRGARLSVSSAGLTVADIVQGVTPTSGQFYKLGAAVKTNDFALYSNSLSIGTDTSGAMPLSDSLSLSLGSRLSATDSYLNGHIRKLSYHPQRLSNANLIALTS